MATSHGLEQPAPSVLVLTAGDFGQGVGERLRASHGAVVQPIGPNGTHPGLWPHWDLLVLATGHERTRLAEAIDRVAFSWKRPWFPVYSSATHLYCGPVVVPGRTACYRCFGARREQHRVSTHAGPAVTYEVDTAHPVHHIGIAGALCAQAVIEAFGPPSTDSLGATVRVFDQISGGVSAHPVVATDGCPRCRRPRSPQDEQELWKTLTAAASVTTGPDQRQEAMQR